MREIKEILNPVHLPTVDEWMRIAELTIDERFTTIRTGYECVQNTYAINLQQRFEEITRGKWVEISDNDDYDIDQVINHGADVKVKKVWEPALLLKDDFGKNGLIDGEFEINEGYVTEIFIKGIGLFVCGTDTLYDIFYQAEKHKLEKKGKLFVTEMFINQLLK